MQEIGNIVSASPLLRGYFTVIAALLGMAIGSFAACQASRQIAGESVLRGRSHCDVCGHQLNIIDLLPVLGYLLLKGRCRYCGTKLGRRFLYTELFMGAVYAVGFWNFGLSLSFVLYACSAGVLLALSLVDLDTYEIPDGYIIALVGIWAAVNVAALLMGQTDLRTLGYRLLSAVAVSGAMLLLSMLFDKLLGKESMGGGDIKLYFAVGLYLGFLNGYLCVVLSCILGLIMAGVWKKNKIPFGPSIALAMILCMNFGERIVNWYVNLL